jgi:hypothetical protein
MKLRALATVALLCAFGLAAYPTRAQQTFSYPNFNSTTGLTLKGSTASVLNGNANVLRITPNQGNSVGSTWYSTTLPLQAGFTTTFTFQFTGQGGSGGHADGIAFVVQGSPAGNQYLDTVAGGSVGYGDDDGDTTKGAGVSNSLAFEFDTFQNGWDPNNNHVSIQSCGSGSNNQHHNVESTCASGRTGNATIAINSALTGLNININDGNQHTAVITYSPPSSGVNNLTVTLDNQSVLAVPFDIATLGLGTNSPAFVGFTASTGGGFENQDIVSWSFSSQTITQPVSTSQPTTFAFNNNAGTELVHAVDFSTAAGNLNYPLGDPNTIVIQSTNNSVDATTWPQYVHGGPFATSLLFPLVDDNTAGGSGTNGGLFVDLCYDPTIHTTQAQTPSDANCPSVSTGSTNFLGVDVTADLVSKPAIAPGTISVLAHYEPPSATPLLPWSPTTVSATANPACVTTTGSSSGPQPAAPANCNTLDVQQTISGDSTTSSGKVRNKGTFAFAYNVPMLESTVSVNGAPVNQPGVNNPSSSAALWFSAQNAPLNLSFLVNPACPTGLVCPLSATVAAANNFFQAAPVASESFSVTQGTNTFVPPTTATPPIGFSTATVQPVTFKGLVNGGSVPDGTYLLQWSATDNVGIPEQFQTLTPFTGTSASTCSDGSPVQPGGACYNTSSFAATLNIDSTSPTITVTNPINANYAAGQKVAASYSCSDPTPGAGLASGSTGCHGPVANAANIDTTPNGAGTTNKTFTVTSADAAIPANTASKSVSYTVTCHYAALSVNPNSVKKPALVGVTASVTDCMPTAQNVSVKFTLSGPLGRNCSNDSTVMFTTPTFTIKAGASNSITFPFIIPNSVCAGTYTISTTTIQSGTPVDTSTTSLTVR